jgi:hypothetical protein
MPLPCHSHYAYYQYITASEFKVQHVAAAAASSKDPSTPLLRPRKTRPLFPERQVRPFLIGPHFSRAGG